MAVSAIAVVADGVRLPAEFADYAIRRMDDLEAAAIDRSWWTQQRSNFLTKRRSRTSCDQV